jgi:diguanylate cyclase (GGDEF)-like protein
MGQIPYHDFTYKALDIGMIVDAVLLSLALAHRVKITNEEKLIAEKASKTDVLTGLMNRRAYYEISTNEVHRSGRYGGKLSLMLLDIDHFKEFNDNYGHDIGDTALEHFANLLIKMKRKDDYAFRLGGDEFLLLLPETEKDEAEHLAQRIQDEVKTHRIHLQELTLTMSTSYGVAQLEEDDISIKEAEKRADRALYKTKKSASHKS